MGLLIDINRCERQGSVQSCFFQAVEKQIGFSVSVLLTVFVSECKQPYMVLFNEFTQFAVFSCVVGTKSDQVLYLLLTVLLTKPLLPMSWLSRITWDV